MRSTAVLLLTMMIAACATNATRESALLLVDQLDEYEKAVTAKVAAEQRFYAQTRDDLSDQARRQARREQQEAFLVGLTEIADQALVRDKGLQLSVLQRYLRDLNETGRTAEETRSQREAELRALYDVNFKTLSTKRAELARTRSQLLQLAREKSTTDELQRFLQESARRAVELNQEREEQDEARAGGGN